MRHFETSVVVQLSARDYWSLKTDASFERVCAEQVEGGAYHITSLEHGNDASGGETVLLMTEVTAEESPLPPALQVLLGTTSYTFASRASWWRKRYDRDHPLTFETTPRGTRKKVVIRGQTWAKPLTAKSCRVYYSIEIECHIHYQSLSKLLEQGLEKHLRTSYAKLALLANEYWHNQESYLGMLDTPETIERHLGAKATPHIITIATGFGVVDSPPPPTPPPVRGSDMLQRRAAAASCHRRTVPRGAAPAATAAAAAADRSRSVAHCDRPGHRLYILLQAALSAGAVGASSRLSAFPPRGGGCERDHRGCCGGCCPSSLACCLQQEPARLACCRQHACLVREGACLRRGHRRCEQGPLALHHQHRHGREGVRRAATIRERGASTACTWSIHTTA